MHSIANGRTLADIATDIKEEIKEFVQTRVQLFQAEFREKVALLKIAGVLAAIAAILLATVYLLLTMGLVAVIAAVFTNSPYRWAFAFFGVAVLWLILGGAAAYFAKREFSLKGVMPRRTFEVLKGDKIWIQREAKDQL
jgi:uncharacterized membrane protein YqjE